jgi:hypothetical protein
MPTPDECDRPKATAKIPSNRALPAMLEDFAKTSYLEFNDLLDCIWKLTRQLTNIKNEELAKLPAYFGDNEALKQARWRLEGYKIDYVFPLALSYSFAVLVFIELATKLMQLCEVVYQERKPIVRAKDLAGSGIERYMKYLEFVTSLKRNDIKYWDQIAALQKIRNCIVHTAGMVEASRDAGALRQLVASESYLVAEHHPNHASSSDMPSSRITISQDKNGDRLIIQTLYPCIVAVYARDFLLGVIQKVDPSATDWIQPPP